MIEHLVGSVRLQGKLQGKQFVAGEQTHRPQLARCARKHRCIHRKRHTRLVAVSSGDEAMHAQSVVKIGWVHFLDLVEKHPLLPGSGDILVAAEVAAEVEVVEEVAAGVAMVETNNAAGVANGASDPTSGG